MEWTLEEALAYYRKQGAPGDQAALIALLREIMQEKNGISYTDLNAVIEAYGLRQTYLLALIRRFPGLRLQNTHCLEICAGPNCGRSTHIAQFVEKTYGKTPAKFTVKYVPCMRMCGKGPNIRWDGTLYHRADEALLRTLIEDL